MRDATSTVLIINGAEPSAYSRGEFNGAMAKTATAILEPYFTVLTTTVADGYDVADEIAKYKAADVVMYQYPIFWFMVPAALKKYMDDVFTYGEFFTYTDSPYGTGGMMQGKKAFFSTTWNAPEQAFNNKDTFFDGANPTEVILNMRKAHQYCGFEELPHFFVHNVVRDPQLDINRTRLEQHLHTIFQLKEGTKAA